MKSIRLALRLYVMAVIATACLALLVFAPERVPDNLGLAFVLFAFATCAQLRPIHLTQKVKMTVEDTATFAAALLLAPWLACAVAADHRQEAFAVCAELVDEVKRQLPIWKRQVFADGTDEWVNCP